MTKLRELAPEERAIWERVAQDVTRLRVPSAQVRPHAQTGSTRNVLIPERPFAQKSQQKQTELGSAQPKTRVTQNDEAIRIGTRLSGLDNASWRGLLKGSRPVERRLDLHGYIVQDAFERLRKFMFDAKRDDIRCIEVVTGLGSRVEGGALRRELPHWLERPELRELILGVVYTHRSNKGAVRILLRSARRHASRGKDQTTRKGSEKRF